MTTANGKAETVIKNANIITMEAGDAARPMAQALAMAHGRFIGVGSNEDIEGLVGPGTKVLDLGGKTVLPGFIDAHIHVLNSGVRHVMAADCDLPTLTQVQAELKERVERTPAGRWVQDFKFDDTKTDRTSSNEGRHLYWNDLDSVSTAHRILVAHRAGHVRAVSTGATDYPPGPFEPLLGIQSCVTRTDSTGKEWGVNQKVSRVSIEEALRLYTLNGAYASF